MYRLKRDLGFTDSEVANFTGITPRNVEMLTDYAKKILTSGLIKEFNRLKLDEYALDFAMNRPRSNGRTNTISYQLIREDKNWWEVEDAKERKLIKNRSDYAEQRKKKYGVPPTVRFDEYLEKELFND